MTLPAASFVNIATVEASMEATVLGMAELLNGSNYTAHLVSWPPDAERHECPHDGVDEIAYIIQGSIIDEDERKHTAGDMWQRPAGDTHRPRSGPDGALLLLFHVQSP